MNPGIIVNIYWLSKPFKKSSTDMKIKITHCTACTPEFENITDGSIHEVIEPPRWETDCSGWWVYGVNQPVLVFFSEAEIYL